MVCGPYKGCSPHAGVRRWRSLEGLPVIGRAGSHDTPDGTDEQDGEGHRRADEGGGEGRGQDGEGGRGGMG
jgi:hypothetical protein